VAQRRRRRRLTPKSLREWGAVVPQWVGIFGLLACLAFYFATGRTNAAILVAFGGLIVVGQGAETLSALGSTPPDPDPPPKRK
jgi:hypothetical protein